MEIRRMTWDAVIASGRYRESVLMQQADLDGFCNAAGVTHFEMGFTDEPQLFLAACGSAHYSPTRKAWLLTSEIRLPLEVNWRFLPFVSNHGMLTIETMSGETMYLYPAGYRGFQVIPMPDFPALLKAHDTLRAEAAAK